MERYLALIVLFLLTSCSTPYMTYTADVYLSEQQLCKNAVIKDYGVPGHLFFYDNDRVGHFIIGDITIKNSTDTTFIK